jgi:hypothetical protein
LQSTALKSSSHIGFATLLLMTFSFFSGGCGHTVHKDIKPIVQAGSSYTQSDKKSSSPKEKYWWKAFEDPLLNGLMASVLTDNFTLKQGLCQDQTGKGRSFPTFKYPNIGNFHMGV